VRIQVSRIVLATAASGVLLAVTAALALAQPGTPSPADPAVVEVAQGPAPTSESVVPTIVPSLAPTAAGRPTPPARRPGRNASGPPVAPADLSDLSAWLDYRFRAHVAALPHEARLFYRRGLELRQAGSHEEAVRLVRGASELDPAFLAPHLTLASWFLMREPSQALLQYAAVLELLRHDFMLQLALAANALHLGLQALFLGLLAAGLLIMVLHAPEARHPIFERLALVASPESARVWSWILLALPFAAGFGVTIPVIVGLGLLWPLLRGRERTVWVMLVMCVGGTPWLLGLTDRLSAPMREETPPYYGVPMIQNEPASPARIQELAARAAAHPDNGFLQFGHAWLARRGGDLAAAEQGFRAAIRCWPTNARPRIDLGNTLAMQGRTDEALELYTQATRLEPTNAAAWYNMSQIYTHRYLYREATDAMSRASALNFDLVKSYQSQATDDGMLPLVDEWLTPATFWQALRDHRVERTPAAVPPAWRGRLETSGLRFTVVAVALALISLVVGLRMQRGLPLRACSNCGAIVCRRCAERRREHAFCPACAGVESRAESPEFARVLLLQHRRRIQGTQHMVRTAFATLIPGFGPLAFRRAFTPVALLVATAALSGQALGLGAPFPLEPRLAIPEADVPVPLMVTAWLMIYAVSILSYFSHVARARAQEAANAAPVRSRSVQSTRRASAAAA
jgi:tetratricopeptide (TPR) repeat protein